MNLSFFRGFFITLCVFVAEACSGQCQVVVQSSPVLVHDSSIPFTHSLSKLPVNSNSRPLASGPQLNGEVSGTDFRTSWVESWPLGIDKTGLSSMQMTVSGIDGNGNPISDRIIKRTFSGSPPVWYWQLSARIDTTHFKSGSVMKIAVTPTGFPGGASFSPAELKYKVLNAAYILTNHTFGPVANQILDSWNDSMTLCNVGGRISDVDSSSTILNLLPYYTVLYEGSHGQTGTFFDCNATETTSGGAVNYFDIVPKIQEKVSLNSIPIPPYNFVFCDSCDSAGNLLDTADTSDYGLSNSLLLGSGSPFNRGYLEDTAFLGWTLEVAELPSNADFSDTIGEDLSQGEPLTMAMDDAASTSWAIGVTHFIGAYPVYGIIPAVYYGDPMMKLSGVYNKTHLTGLNWFTVVWNDPPTTGNPFE